MASITKTAAKTITRSTRSIPLPGVGITGTRTDSHYHYFYTRQPRSSRQRPFSSSSSSPASYSHTQKKEDATTTKDKQILLEKPDKFRPPSHPARRVLQTRNGRLVNPGPINYPGPKLSEKEKEELKHRRYPHMFPPEGTVMFKFLTNRWIHVWIAMGVLTSLATFTFTTNFKQTSPFAHLLPPWSALLSHPIDTISQALSVYKMHVQHTSMLAREKRQRRVDDAEKRRQYRIAHGLEEPPETTAENKAAASDAKDVVGGDDQSPVAVEVREKEKEGGMAAAGGSGGRDEFVDWEGKRKPVKKWLGIW